MKSFHHCGSFLCCLKPGFADIDTRIAYFDTRVVPSPAVITLTLSPGAMITSAS
ncbi:hypothetical protein [Desulfocicer vacuolatum]|uniref:hypothetical protein n=1 Tax=Desulfocicer vacuolatum TaxID=2298 RepID=UPI001483314B|nr:hypothetical protein [Desulfocicer vacuolatum]